MITEVITVVDLPQLTTQEGWKGPIPVLYCPECHQENSANARDYRNLPRDHEFYHCEYPMELVTKEIRYVPWSKEEHSQ